MGSWNPQPSLDEIIFDFPVKLKQAMYASAMRGTIARGTWNHCALNAADKMMSLGEDGFKTVARQSSGFVNSTEAAEKFGITKATAKHFIRVWDSLTGMTDEEATEYLKDCILRAGLFTDPGVSDPKIIRRRVFTSEETKMREEFEKMMAKNFVYGEELAFDMLTVSPEMVDA